MVSCFCYIFIEDAQKYDEEFWGEGDKDIWQETETIEVVGAV